METKMNMEKVTQAIKDFVEIAGVHVINPEYMVLSTHNDQPVVVNSNKKKRPIVILHEGMMSGDYVILNIFKEPLGSSDERDWFYSSKSYMLGHLIREMIRSIIKLSIDDENKKNIDYNKLEMIVEFMDEIDNKTENELNLIGKATNFLNIFYHKKKKVAQLQTELFDDEFIKSFGSKIRKKTWKLFQNLICTFLNSENIFEDYTYKATILGMPEGDATLHVLVQTLECIHEYVKIFLGVDIDINSLIYHVDNLEKYHKASAWFLAPAAKKESKGVVTKAPWESTVPNENDVISPSQSSFSTPATSFGSCTNIPDPDKVIGNMNAVIGQGSINAQQIIGPSAIPVMNTDMFKF